ncbi:MAG: DNA cytosine methyltransferase [Anaerolineae bacterium]|nr:DNA cytosine methyltransferase [Anaerolineae bacterium]MCO5192242.1 DNA cytosine methyltransferase [Anaerolineae bacterium]MCO5204124.1 DNA cytosine methyltransferase [Anaerolineae bacterium]
MQKLPQRQPVFADIFAGCGGLSLGLINAGWQGVFAIEKHPHAFETLKTNLMSPENEFFCWPEWLPRNPIDVSKFVTQYEEKLTSLKGKLTLLAGGPPCQGFSLAGERAHTDPRNLLVKEYIKVVSILEPRILLIENVQGFALAFKKNGNGKHKYIPYSDFVIKQLESLGYKAFHETINFSDYGVPQFRRRFILIAVKKSDPLLTKLNGRTPFELLVATRKEFLSSKGLSSELPVSVKQAIGDLEVHAKELVESNDSPIKGFKQIAYKSSCFSSSFIELMRKNYADAPNSLRLPRHRPQTTAQFKRIIDSCTLGKTISKDDRIRLGISKRAITPLDENLPSVTVTTLPDDIIHYSEPRILTVRENARLQTFPDWFEFRGNYTTGGSKRKNDCPRYTQVGNAVPPLFAEAIGLILKDLASYKGLTYE